MSAVDETPLADTGAGRLTEVIAAIAAMAPELDRHPRFPTEAFEALDHAGVLALPATGELDIAREWQLLRAVAAADASVARILDGHFNAVARIAAGASDAVRSEQLDRVRAGGHLLGLWGGNPAPGEGAPAVLVGPPAAPTIGGVKTFCSGAGGVNAALVLAADAGGRPPHLCLVEMGPTAVVDSSWYRASGLRASESHRVSFLDTPVEAVIGDPGELSREPHFSADALRTTVTWAGMADAARAAALDFLAERRAGDELAALAAGRIEAAHGTIDVWLTHAQAAVEARAPLRDLAIATRAEVIRAAHTILDVAAQACGSWPFATGGTLDRARRDLELFTLQHRIDPLLQRLGTAALDRHSP